MKGAIALDFFTYTPSLDKLAKYINERSEEFDCCYASAWAYLINKTEKGDYTFNQVVEYMKDNEQYNEEV